MIPGNLLPNLQCEFDIDQFLIQYLCLYEINFTSSSLKI